MPSRHPLLLRQLRRLGISPDAPPTAQQWPALLERIGRAYAEADQERYLLDRSQEISSREMRELYRRLEEAQRIAGLGYWTLNFAQNEGFWSEECYRIAGLDPRRPVPSYRRFIELIHPDDRAWVKREVRDAMRAPRDFRIECRFLHADGAVRWASVIGHPSATDHGAATRMAGSVLDVTQRKIVEERMRALNVELEARVEERTRQLEAVIGELQSFSYSVSHDLRAPLRAINGFAHLLEETALEQLEPASRGYLQRILAATVRMGNLIDGLLALSNISRAPLTLGPVDLSRIAAEIVAELHQAEPDRKVEVVIESRVSAQGDPVLLQALLENLLRNAWKFTGKNPQARIEFRRAPLNGRPAYCVRDNGVGFDMSFADKLFTAFSRLHSPADFPGTGIGLATVQRIINAHGGRITAISTPGVETVFTFTLGGELR